MNKLEQYILKYQGLHSGTDVYINDVDGKTYLNNSEVGKAPVLFDGSQLIKRLVPFIKRIIESKQRAVTLLDYGCGQAVHNFVRLKSLGNQTFHEKFAGNIQCYYCYDPAVAPYSLKPPKAMVFDIVCCADVMEHIPEEYVDEVLREIQSYTSVDGSALFTISGNPGLKSFSDGEKFHVTVRPVEWWAEKIASIFTNKNFLILHKDDNRADKILSIKYRNTTKLNVWGEELNVPGRVQVEEI